MKLNKNSYKIKLNFTYPIDKPRKAKPFGLYNDKPNDARKLQKKGKVNIG